MNSSMCEGGSTYEIDCVLVTMSQRTRTVAAANSKRSSSVLGAF